MDITFFLVIIITKCNTIVIYIGFIFFRSVFRNPGERVKTSTVFMLLAGLEKGNGQSFHRHQETVGQGKSKYLGDFHGIPSLGVQ